MSDLIHKGDGWQAAAIPPEEPQRLAELAHYHILDTDSSPSFDRITQMVSRKLGVKFALVSLIDENRQWFKSACGIDAQETSRDEAFCAHAILGDSLFVVLDAGKDERFRGNPLVAGEPHIRFYAGAPLISPKGFRLGTLCAIDTEPRAELLESDYFTLETLAAIVVDEMELHRVNLRLEQQIQAKSNFLAVMSHEIRTPMNGVVGMASLLASTELNDKQRRCVEVICQSADAMMLLMDDILDLSKMEAGKLALETKPIDMLQLFVDTMDAMGPTASEKGLMLALEYDDMMPLYAQGDAARIRQVLLNLLSNAIKFTHEGSVTVRLEGEQRADLIDYHFSVNDTGIGIPEDEQQHIFNSFDQADMSSTRKFGGTGLGLAICRLLCRRMGGQVTVKSQPKQGASFAVQLALLADPERIAEPLHPPYRTADGLYRIESLR